MKVLKQFDHEVALSFNDSEIWNSDLYIKLYAAANNKENIKDVIINGTTYNSMKVSFMGSIFNSNGFSRVVELQEV